MRPISIGPITDIQDVQRAFQEVENASQQERIISIAASFTVTNHTETRSLDVSTATATDVANFVATLILDMQRGGRVGQ